MPVLTPVLILTPQALNDIQKDIQEAVQARDKAQRDVHFMLVEQEKREDEGVIKSLQRELAKVQSSLAKEKGMTDKLRDRLAESERLHDIAMAAGNKEELLYLTHKLEHEKQALEDKVIAIERKNAAEKAEVTKKLRGKDIEVMLQKAALHRIQEANKMNRDSKTADSHERSLDIPAYISQLAKSAHSLASMTVSDQPHTQMASHNTTSDFVTKHLHEAAGRVPGTAQSSETYQSGHKNLAYWGFWKSEPGAICLHCGHGKKRPKVGQRSLSPHTRKSRARLNEAMKLIANAQSKLSQTTQGNVLDFVQAQDHRNRMANRARFSHPTSQLPAKLVAMGADASQIPQPKAQIRGSHVVNFQRPTAL